MDVSPTSDAPAASSGSGLQQRLEQNPYFRWARRFYHRHEGIGPPLFFFGGVTWDAATLRRIDAWFDNLFLLAYLIGFGVLVMWVALDRHHRLQNPRLRAWRDWFLPGIQFLAGALFSAYVIYYSQSASWTTSAFLIVLISLLVANEFIWGKTPNLYVLFGVYFLACTTFFVFFLPVLTGTMGAAIFWAASLISCAIVGVMLMLLRRWVALRGLPMAALIGLVITLFGVFHLFYWQNWIPPVPLALRAGGVYHDVEVTNGAYVLTEERHPWYQSAFGTPTIHRAPGDTVFCFAAVFAPTELETQIAHHWQFYDDAQNRWQTTDRIAYEVTGGRHGGYRGYTFKRHTRPGRWRIDVKTPDGLLIGRIRFRIAPADTTRALPLRTRRYE